MRVSWCAMCAALVMAACTGPPAEEGAGSDPRAWFLEVVGEGGVWLGPDDLATMGVEALQESAPPLRLTWGEEELSYLALSTSQGWGAFFYNADRSNRATRRTAIRLDSGAEGRPMVTDVRGTARADEAPAAGLATLRWEVDQQYVPQAMTETPWFWQALRTPSAEAVTEMVALPGALAGPITVTAHLWSHTSSDADPDHRLRMTWDGETVGQWDWDGQGMQHLRACFANTSQEEHSVGWEAPAVAGAEVALLWLDAFEVTYPRRVTADGSVWLAGGGALAVEAAAPGARAVDVTDPSYPKDLGRVASGDILEVARGHRYWIGVPQEARSPVALRPARALDLEALEGTTYLAVAPLPLHAPLEPLLAHRRSQGLTAAAVDVQAVRDTLGTGQPNPEAVRRLADQIPSLQYLLVVGDGTAEPEGYDSEVGSLRVETPFTRTRTLGETPADAILGMDADGHLRVAVGRLPATSRSELKAMVEKTIEWELDGSAPRWLIVSDDEAEFAALADEIARAAPLGTGITRIDSAEEGSRTDLLEALRQGRAWLNYTGHGSLTVLCDDGLLRLEDGDSWRQPVVVVAWTCLAAHFVHPTQDSMAEVWLREPRGGAAAFLGPVGETTSGEQEPFVDAFYEAVSDGETLGQSWLAALEEGSSEDVRWGYVLLGDPALRLVQD